MNKVYILLLAMVANYNVNAQDFGKRENINKNWFFNLGDVQYGGREEMDCSKWPVVDVPHDWTVKQNASPELASSTGYLPGGIAWYRKDIEVSSEKKGNKVYVYFEGVYNNSEVFINGKWVGKRPNGYISFMYDLTPYIKWGKKNTIAVRVDHSNDADSRWYTGSGIYRDVYLVYANPTHIDLWGTTYQAKVKNNKADITVSTTIKNTIETSSLKIVHELYDTDGKRVASTSNKGLAFTKSSTDFNTSLKLNAPKLWSITSPYLYTLTTKVYKGAKLIDESNIKAGFRTIDFDPNKGFSLNGINTKLKGVCLHHDAGVLGAAATKSVWRSRLETLKEIGVNAIRTSHNPQAPYLYELCDELGFVMMDEAFDEWEYPKNKWIEGWNRGEPGHQGTSQYFREWSLRDVKDQILRDRKHPSVIMWSIGNEVDYPNDPYTHPVLADEGISQKSVRAHLKDHPNAERLGDIAKELVAVVKEADSSRPVTAALAGAVMSNYTDYPFVLDIVGYNYTENKYDSDHKLYPERVLYGSENRHDIGAWKAVKDKEFIFGQFLWTGIDYLGESHAWPSRGFESGLLDLAGNIKPRGYFRKSLWSTKPMVYIGTVKKQINQGKRWGNRLSTDAPKRWNYDENAKVQVLCYSNGDAAELQLNGKTIGERKPYDPETGVIAWDVNYEPGELKVIAYKDGKIVATDNIVTNTLTAEIRAKVLKATDEELIRQISVEMYDTNGRFSALADSEITCYVAGGKLLGMENASTNVAENFQDNKHRCINGRMLIYVKKENKNTPVKVKLSSPLMKSLNLVVD
ncbi:glycoside hydrolase family 2 TIM barrel-domain containing protein [Wenyingzhuangia sp. chi5]|uniref:Glycoside hydrolase family 2 TIM barrel-domain containing protein n=1 Tax=Wenyingzhuangia gilva TaxID=3057677 RepID=A0ABT8VUB9_9FLAO|nr:sugar-binding domain-containing protein [Wenyingzhuangia sp. chi5]MDO3695568.1 glycoside hydrolase family 2 TIM barrel-domain containing protein [Wenyingzhuangia sp. chi5]